MVQLQTLGLCVSVLLAAVEGFSVQSRTTTHRLCQSPTQLRAATLEPDKKKAPAKKKEKVTKEAEELLAMLKLKEDNAEDRPLLVAQIAPAVRLAFPEEFGREPGSYSPGLLVTSLKELGFDLVLDTNTAADLTIMEEGTELLHRIQARVEREKQGKEEPLLGQENPGPNPMPLFTSCCPGWMQLVEKSSPELMPYISTCKSPHMMFGALVKEHSDDMLGFPPDKVYFTSVMPCVRKRGESDQEAFVRADNVRDIDNVVTTKDIGLLLRMKGVNPEDLEPSEFDSPFQTDGTGSGAGQIFGVTGGVMEAAVRSVYELVTESQLPKLEVEAVRGLDGVKEATLSLYNEETKKGIPMELKVAVANGLGNAKKLIKQMKEGEVHYDFVEVMACPGGCINGGGQPKGEKDAVDKRFKKIYEFDQALPRRRSHTNPTVHEFYERYMGEAGSEEAHRLLHVEPVYGKNGKNLKP